MPLTLTRSLLTVLIPGAIAVAPWALWFLTKYPQLRDIYEHHEWPFHVLTFVICVVVGSIVEGFAAYVEKRWDCEIGGASDSEDEDLTWVEEDWYEYLARSHGAGEPVAYRYLSRKVTSLYFELGIALAYPSFSLGLLQMLLDEDAPAHWIFGASVVHLALPLILLKYAADTHYVLCITRYYVMRKMRKPISCDAEPRVTGNN